LNGQPGYTWALRGHTPYLTTACAYQRLSAISAVTPCGKLCFDTKHGSYKEDDVIQFLITLYVFLGKKMLIIWDGASIHRSKKVMAFVNDNVQYKDIFQVERLPPYSPELNPDELVWADLKVNKLKSHINSNLDELSISLNNALKDLQKEPEKIKAFFKKESICFY
jgi:transposase